MTDLKTTYPVLPGCIQTPQLWPGQLVRPLGEDGVLTVEYAHKSRDGNLWRVKFIEERFSAFFEPGAFFKLS